MTKFKRLVCLLLTALLLCGCTPVPDPTEPGKTDPPPTGTQPTTQSTEPTTQPTTEPTTQPTTGTPGPTEPEPERFTLSFAGDCTFGDNYDAEGAPGGFCSAVKDRYDYPFSNVKTYFRNDDYSLVNLECALTESDPTEEEMEELKEHRFRFRGPKEYTQILIEGGVEFASCANNHSRDYGKQGLYDTWDALEEAEIDYASFGKSCVVTTDSGLTLGICAIFFNFTEAQMENTVQYLRNKGAEVVIVSIHWGDEGVYRPNDLQVNLGHTAIDAGADIVFGHHSHTLMPVEAYHGGIIYYSLGNFSFGGNRNPKDKDTAILQQEILRHADGTISLGGLTVIPCRVSSVENWNDFRPTPYDPEDPGYSRVFAKLEGTFETPPTKEELNPETQPTETQPTETQPTEPADG